jgi:hypothetical protein
VSMLTEVVDRLTNISALRIQATELIWQQREMSGIADTTKGSSTSARTAQDPDSNAKRWIAEVNYSHSIVNPNKNLNASAWS